LAFHYSEPKDLEIEANAILDMARNLEAEVTRRSLKDLGHKVFCPDWDGDKRARVASRNTELLDAATECLGRCEEAVRLHREAF